MDYYNKQRYQWHLAKLAPNEYYQFVTAGGYPLDVASVPPLPKITKESAMLRAGFGGVQDLSLYPTSKIEASICVEPSKK